MRDPMAVRASNGHARSAARHRSCRTKRHLSRLGPPNSDSSFRGRGSRSLPVPTLKTVNFDGERIRASGRAGTTTTCAAFDLSRRLGQSEGLRDRAATVVTLRSALRLVRGLKGSRGTILAETNAIHHDEAHDDRDAAFGRWNGGRVLRLLGEDLDAGRSPRVFRGGVLWPSAAFPEATENALGTSEEVIDDGATTEAARDVRGAAGAPRPEGSASGTWQGSAGSLAAGARRPAGSTTPQFGASEVGEATATGSMAVTNDDISGAGSGGEPGPALFSVNRGLPPDVAREVEGIVSEYPQLRMRFDDEVLWLSGGLSPVPNYAETFSIVVAVPHDIALPVRAWAWWACGVAVGPRHVNPDGSICAFEQGDSRLKYGEWQRGSSLVALLDLVATWLVRQCYCRDYGRWPGQQMLHSVLERQEWNRRTEACGCGGMRQYKDCHASTDARASAAEIAREVRAKVSDLRSIRESLHRRAPPSNAVALHRAALCALPSATRVAHLPRPHWRDVILDASLR